MDESKNFSGVNPARPARSDGEQTRERLLMAGLRLFAEKGYAQTSTREIAAAAQANIAAIAYYFEGKAGLYRTLYNSPVLLELGQVAAPEQRGPDLEALFAQDKPAWLFQALHRFYGDFTEAHKSGELVRLCTRLHMREMIDPTGVIGPQEDCSVMEHHEAIRQILGRYFGVDAPDRPLCRLEHALVGMGMYLYVGRDVTDQLCPDLMQSAQALDDWREQLAWQACALVELEARRRASAQTPTPEAAAPDIAPEIAFVHTPDFVPDLSSNSAHSPGKEQE